MKIELSKDDLLLRFHSMELKDIEMDNVWFPHRLMDLADVVVMRIGNCEKVLKDRGGQTGVIRTINPNPTNQCN